MPFASPFDERPPVETPRPARTGGSQAFCVRTCDGRYFPIASVSGQSRAETCKSFCPASETRVYLGGTIDGASAEAGGKNYSDLPNAFRYRNELVAGCTCNGADPVGLAKISIEDDRTLRRGDIVMQGDGLMVAARNADRRGAMNFTPASPRLRARIEGAPILARE